MGQVRTSLGIRYDVPASAFSFLSIYTNNWEIKPVACQSHCSVVSEAIHYVAGPSDGSSVSVFSCLKYPSVQKLARAQTDRHESENKEGFQDFSFRSVPNDKKNQNKFVVFFVPSSFPASARRISHQFRFHLCRVLSCSVRKSRKYVIGELESLAAWRLLRT